MEAPGHTALSASSLRRGQGRGRLPGGLWASCEVVIVVVVSEAAEHLSYGLWPVACPGCGTAPTALLLWCTWQAASRHPAHPAHPAPSSAPSVPATAPATAPLPQRDSCTQGAPAMGAVEVTARQSGAVVTRCDRTCDRTCDTTCGPVQPRGCPSLTAGVSAPWTPPRPVRGPGTALSAPPWTAAPFARTAAPFWCSSSWPRPGDGTRRCGGKAGWVVRTTERGRVDGRWRGKLSNEKYATPLRS